MDVISRNTFSSTLNPNAPMFVPSAYRAVEDFSDQWWSLVNSSPWFRDYWLQERFQDPQAENDDLLILPDLDDLFESNQDDEPEEEEEKERDDCGGLDLITLGSLKWRKSRGVLDTPRFMEKAPKHVKVKASPRCIQQPR